MEKSSAVTIEGENYEVVDECIEDEDTSGNTQQKVIESTEVENKSTDVESKSTDVESKSTDVVTTEDNVLDANIEQEKVTILDSVDNTLSNNTNFDNNIEDITPNVESQCLHQSSAESVDLNVHTNSDQIEEQKDMTDEDVLHNLDEIENIVLDSSDFQTQKEEQDIIDITENENACTESNTSDQNTVKNEDAIDTSRSLQNITKISEHEMKMGNPDNVEWYEKKLAQKEAIIRGRLSKVARVLAISYPRYEEWLEHTEKVYESPLCKLRPSRRCCLDKPYTNRWKFICKKVNNSALEMDSCDDSSNKHTETVWKMEASSAWGVDVNNEAEFPPFVLKAVKIFEDFLQTTEQLTLQNSANENFADDVPLDMESKKVDDPEGRPEWSWLLVRCNSMDELMLFATGKDINRFTMDQLKQVYESGPGKDCNVKSLYCKSTNKYNDITVTNTTFLVGSEALDEIVGGLKVQLAPKTNFWSNTAGAENVAKTVIDLLAPTSKTTVLEIGCGIGLIGLMMASKCLRVVGVDSPSEVEEAEMICELNNIKNASFIMGTPTDIAPKLMTTVKNRRASVVINANTNIGRAIEVMLCLRKITSIKKIVMITTLTKQSVRAILELARPGDQIHGLPFIPIVACVVDTLPIGPHFEAVILMQRKMVDKIMHGMPKKIVEQNIKTEKNDPEIQILERSTNTTDKKILPKGTHIQPKKNFNKSLVKHARKMKFAMKKMLYGKNLENSVPKNNFRGKRSHSPDKDEAPPQKIMKKFGKFGAKPWHTDLPIKKERMDNTQLRINPLYEKKMREANEQTDLRERLSNTRVDTDIAQTVKEHQALLEIAKEKLSGPAPTVDVNTAKQLQSMLNMVLEQTNKLQSQLPRSVWDRIAAPENMNSNQRDNEQNDPQKNRYVQHMNSQDILITTLNEKFANNEECVPQQTFKKYNNLPPLEPNTVIPVAHPINHVEDKPFRITPERYRETEMRQQQTQENLWNRDRTFEKNRWNEVGNMKKPNSPMRREYRISPPKRLSPKRPLLSPPRRPCSPPRRHFSPLCRPTSPMHRQRSPMRRQMSPSRRPLSPKRLSPPQRLEMLMNRSMSPLSRQVSPLRRQMSPIRSNTSPCRRQPSPIKRPMSPRRQIPSPNRLMCSNNNNRQEVLLIRRLLMPQERQQTSTLRRTDSPQRYLFERPVSPSRRQQSPQRRQMSPQKFTDDWDIPSRGAIEQNTWTRPPVERMSEQNMWQTEKVPTPNNSWEQTASDDKRRKTFNQDTNRNDMWNKGGNIWSSKQILTKPTGKETWSSNSDNRWSNTTNMPSNSNSNWNIRGKEGFTSCKEPWMDNKKQGRWETLNVKDSWKQGDKEDLNDLPDDAKDPWGDDGTSDLKERWHKYDGAGTSSTWVRENEQGDSWAKNNKDIWQNKESFTTKPPWRNNSIQNAQSRWLSQSDIEKKTSSGWQSLNTVGSWQHQNSNFQSQRRFTTNQFKGLY